MTIQEREATNTLRYVEGRIEEQSAQLQALQAGQQQLQSDMNKGFQEVNSRLDSRTDGIESRLNARITESENRVNARIVESENRVNARITEVETRMDDRITALETRMEAGFAELRASVKEANRRIDRVFYTLVGMGGTLLVGMAITLIRTFISGS